MATLIKSMIDAYQHINYDLADPRTNDWFLITTPWPALAIIIIYLQFIHRLGPNMMANRPPMKLDRIIQVYDVVQIIASAYLFYKALYLGWGSTYSWKCEPIDFSNTPHAIEVAWTVYLYFIIKVMDLLDTVFFVLRKKDNQISFLHVYHHAGMVVASWGGTKYLPGGHGTFIGFLNSFVHTIMYTHYLVMSLKIWKPWWKKYITQMQLLQFAVLFAHFLQLFWEDCGYPTWPAFIFIPQNLFMMILFGDFYYKVYIKNPKKRAEAQKAQEKSALNGKPKNQ